MAHTTNIRCGPVFGGQVNEPLRIYQEYKESYSEWKVIQLELIGNADITGSYWQLRDELRYVTGLLEEDLSEARLERNNLVSRVFEQKKNIVNNYKELYAPVEGVLSRESSVQEKYKVSVEAKLRLDDSFVSNCLSYINQNVKGSFYGKIDGRSKLISLVENIDCSNSESVIGVLDALIHHLSVDTRERYNGEERAIDSQVKNQYMEDFYGWLFSLDYILPHYILELDGKGIKELSPGEKGALLLVFYLILDQDNVPLIIDQPEDNLDNESVFNILVPYIREAKKRRQIIIVTHNPNLAVVCDAEQIIYVSIDKKDNFTVSHASGAIENDTINKRIVKVLEGTMPAFHNRKTKYELANHE